MTEKLETEDDYRNALKRFLELCTVPEDSPYAGELLELIEELEDYEKVNC
jgi:hypothetical protein